ncbi:MAG: hypothetical protein L0229_29350 [Blastocatellia bacterium]|nr:hypothetical protein [Blastocatellia bacterium]
MKRLDLSLQWVLAHAMPMLLVLALFAAAGEAAGNTPMMSFLSFGLLFAWVMSLQGLVMKRQGYRTGSWMIATVAGIAASAVIGMIALAILDGTNILPEDSVMEIMPGILIAGTVLGLMQWLALRRQASGSGWWIPASAIGFLLGGIVYWLARNQVSLMDDYGLGFPGRYELALLVAAFAGYGAMTGMVLVGMRRTPALTTNLEPHL